MRGDDGARLLEVAQLEGDRRADDLGLELERDGERAHPIEPVFARALEELARGGVDRRLEGLVRPQDQRDRLDQRERRLVHDIGEGGIGGDAQRVGAARIADVVRPAGTRGARAPVVERRPDPDLDARQAGHRLDAAEDLWRIEHTLETLEAGHEVGDAHGVAGAIAQRGLHDRGVAQIGALRGDRALQHHVAEALLDVAGQQARQDGIGIEAREAPPGDAPDGVHQRSGAAVADDREVEGIAQGNVQPPSAAPNKPCARTRWHLANNARRGLWFNAGRPGRIRTRQPAQLVRLRNRARPTP